MTVIFITYHNFRSNSSIQVFSLANSMVDLGHQVHVCIPDGKETATLPGTPRFNCCTYEEALGDPARFETGDQERVIHAWTPREGVRKFTARLQELLGCPVIVHLEDNEDIVTSSILGRDPDRLRAQSDDVLDAIIPDSLSHPHRFRTFLECASGVTILIDRLAEFVPAGKPSLMFWPAHNQEIFHEMPLMLEERRRRGIADHETVLAYVGNVTAANRQEVASLYLAVIILRRMGHATRLVRAGTDCIALFDNMTDEMSDAVIFLGQLDHTDIPMVLGMADFLVQPGRACAYNDYRFPSKLPEFFSIGRPVLLPDTNLGRFVRDGVDAVVLHEGHAMEIADRLVELIHDPAKCERLSCGALEFCRGHFDWEKAANELIGFYEKLGPSALACNSAKATREKFIEPVVRNGICVANTIRFEGAERLRLLGYVVNPGNAPASLAIQLNGVALHLAVHVWHEKLSALYNIEHVYHFEATGEIPQLGSLLEFAFIFTCGGREIMGQRYYFDTKRPPLPESDRRSRVHGTEEVNSFDLSGCTLAHNLLSLAADTLGRPASDIGPVLDWGCGSGRVARFLFPEVRSPYGVDIDADNIKWCAGNIPAGAFSTIGLDPPTPFPARHFELIYAISVLTHLNLRDQDAWLAELARIAKPGGLVLLSVHSNTSVLIYGAGADSAFFTQLAATGYVDGGHDPRLGQHSPDTLRYRSAYHTADYIRKHWRTWFEVLDVKLGWVVGNQDLVILRSR